MKWMSVNELREKYLVFFESKDHLKLKSFPLIPKDDDSLLLINSGMAPMKKYFTGESTPPSKRVTTCQKCIRTPDIERVGITARHGTFFEMLGNFSFGDYFKKEAIEWSFEFFTGVLEIPMEKLWVSIYKDDDEAFDIWTKHVNVPKDKIVRMGKEDNFWEHGKGPCGPCSEIYYDRGEKYGCGNENCGVGCDCDRYIEIWNLVFTQFYNDGNENYTNLEHPNIDTGMGLERLACVMQDVDNLFLVDSVQNILKEVSKISGVKYGQSEKTDISLRVITDHIRSTTFMIADGIIPSNEGRGYVLRRLLRRASRHGRLLMIDYPFLSRVCDKVIEESKDAYPELFEKRDYIKKLIKVEEENFERTIDQGLQLLYAIMEQGEHDDKRIISGKEAFKLNDTYGFPIDLTKEIIAEKGMTIDEEEFERLLSQQRTRARNARKKNLKDAWATKDIDLGFSEKTEFLGYNTLISDVKILAILKDGEIVNEASAGDEIILVTDRTPFYAEGGGQVGDSGYLENSESRIAVLDTTKNNLGIFMHHSTVIIGNIKCKDEFVANVDKFRRLSIMRNHTAAHLLQAALKKVLGKHVEQAGQYVNDELLRFDFTHFSAMTEEEIIKTEQLINDEILRAVSVSVEEMPIEEAKKLGAIALFGEKYGETVRVVSLEDNFSIELCGGTHVGNTARLGLFKIVSESSVASGVRRIEAKTAYGVLKLIDETISLTKNIADSLKVKDVKTLPAHANQLIKDIKAKEKEIEELSEKLANTQIDELLNNAVEINEFKVIKKHLKNTKVDTVRSICDKLKVKCPNVIAVIVFQSGEKANLACACGPKALELGANAADIAKSVAKFAEGNGGGKKDFAMAGFKNLNKIDFALSRADEVIKK